MDHYQSNLVNSFLDSKDINQINVQNKPKVPNSNVNK